MLAILKKRYLLTRQTWLSGTLALAIPIVLAAALASTVAKFGKFSPCLENMDVVLQNASFAEAAAFSDFENSYTILRPLFKPDYFDDLGRSSISAVVGPASAFQGDEQTQLYVSKMDQYFPNTTFTPYATAAEKLEKMFGTRGDVSTLAEMIAMIEANHGEPGFGIFAPSSSENTLVHRMSPEYAMSGLSIITNRLGLLSATGNASRTINTTYRKFRHVEVAPDMMSIPILVLITIGFICSTTVSIMYPVSEKINNVRALQYSNSVSVSDSTPQDWFRTDRLACCFMVCLFGIRHAYRSHSISGYLGNTLCRQQQCVVRVNLRSIWASAVLYCNISRTLYLLHVSQKGSLCCRCWSAYHVDDSLPYSCKSSHLFILHN